jgi:hypothetical protein
VNESILFNVELKVLIRRFTRLPLHRLHDDTRFSLFSDPLRVARFETMSASKGYGLAVKIGLGAGLATIIGVFIVTAGERVNG